MPLPSQSPALPTRCNQTSVLPVLELEYCILKLAVGIHVCKASFTHSNIPEMCLCCHTCSSLFYLLMSSTTTDKNTTSPGDGHLGGVQFLTIMDKRQWMILYKSLCEHILSVFWLKAWKMEELSHKSVCLVLLKTVRPFFTSCSSVLHPHQIVAKFWLLTIHLHQLLVFQGFLTLAVSVGCISHFPDDE